MTLHLSFTCICIQLIMIQRPEITVMVDWALNTKLLTFLHYDSMEEDDFKD